MIFVFSSPRSGSTWLAKILDSHPDTLYLHEPDIVDRGDGFLPFWFETEPTAGEISNAGIYFQRLCSQRKMRVAGTRPMFSKSYRSGFLNGLRTGFIYAGKGLAQAVPAFDEKLVVPDLISAGTAPRIVIKSVSALGRVEVLIRGASPAMRPILLLRNPCAVVQSFLDGIHIGVMNAPPKITRMLESKMGRALNAAAQVNQDNLVDNLSWAWTIANASAHSAVTEANGIVLRYEDLAADPVGVSKGLFAELGLPWSENTRAFIDQASKVDGGYYSVSRNAHEASSRWKAKMNPEHFARIRDIASQIPIGRAYFSAESSP